MGGPGLVSPRGPGTTAGGGGATRPHKLSRRQARKQVRIDQCWIDSGARSWRVVNLHRKDGLVALQGPGARPMFVSFGELARSYRLMEGGR